MTEKEKDKREEQGRDRLHENMRAKSGQAI